MAERLARARQGGAGRQRAAREQRQQAAPAHGRRRLEAEQVEHGRRYVEQVHRLLVAHAGGQHALEPHQQRDAHQLVVDRVGVAQRAVVVELFAVVGDEDDERVAGVTAGVEVFEQAPHVGVHRRHLAAVEVVQPGDLGVAVLVASRTDPLDAVVVRREPPSV